MKLLWFSWKDITNPLAGGAEEVTHNIRKRLVSDGHEVVLISAGYKGAEPISNIDGYTVYRVGRRLTVYIKAWRLFRKKFSDWPDLIIEECNTIPFFTRFYSRQKRIMVFHQLCREVWFYQMFWPLSWLGYWLEPLYLSLLKHENVVTVSNSSKADLIKHGFQNVNIEIIRLGISIERISGFDAKKKYFEPTMLSVGAFRPMKRTLDIVKAFELAKISVPSLKLILAGDRDGPYGDEVEKYIASSSYKEDIESMGRVECSKKKELMQRAHLIAVTSVKEGWGLIVTEANSQGTLAVGYDVDGLRDSIRNFETGVLTKANTPAMLAEAIVEIFQDEEKLVLYSRTGWERSSSNNYNTSYQDFMSALDRMLKN